MQVGGMFDTVQSNTQWTSDIVVLLTRLLHCGMVDILVGWLADDFFPNNLINTFEVNKELFHTVYDIIALLLHHTLGGDSSSCQEGSKREYLNIVKKIKVSLAMAQYKPLFMSLLLTERNRGAAEQKSDPFASAAAHSIPGSLCSLL